MSLFVVLWWYIWFERIYLLEVFKMSKVDILCRLFIIFLFVDCRRYLIFMMDIF